MQQGEDLFKIARQHATGLDKALLNEVMLRAHTFRGEGLDHVKVMQGFIRQIYIDNLMRLIKAHIDNPEARDSQEMMFLEYTIKQIRTLPWNEAQGVLRKVKALLDALSAAIGAEAAKKAAQEVSKEATQEAAPKAQ